MTKEQIAAILFCEEQTITLYFKQVQVQRGHADCGLFAIAFATALCSGKDPTEINFIQHQLRKHLQECLVERDIAGFPQTRRKRTPGKTERTENFQVYCVCRQPEGGEMIECNACQEWFHDLCVKTSTFVWKKSDAVWFCNACSRS